MDEFVGFGAIIVGAALLYFGISWFIDWREDKRREAEKKVQDEIDRQDAHYAAQREKFRRERQSLSKSPSYASHAPNARATVLKMRKDEQSASSSDAIADAMILQSMMYTPSGYLDGSPEPVTGKGGTFDGGGSSGDWSSSSSDSGSSSSSDSSSSSSSDSGSSGGGSD